MSSLPDLKKIARARLKTAKILIKFEDWDGAVYMMGYALEVALKAVVCKTLHLTEYPDNSGSPKIADFFKTHDFDRLLKISGMEYLINSRGNLNVWQNWSEFTQEYPGQWTGMRYCLGNWDKIKVNRMYSNLTISQDGLIELIKLKRKW